VLLRSDHPAQPGPAVQVYLWFLESQDKLGVLLTYQGHRVFQSLDT
jgi:hypothetical protein